MKSGSMIHGVLLAVALLVAYQTWTREEKVERKTGEISVWSVPEAAVTAIVYDTKDRSVRLEKRAEGQSSYVWGTQTHTTRRARLADDGGEGETPEESTTTTEFVGADKTTTLFKELADLRALRDLGTPGDAELAELGLVESRDNITLAYSGGTRSLSVGSKVYGSQDRYVREVTSGRVYVLSGSVLTDLMTGEGALRLRDVHAYKDEDVEKAVVTAAGKTRSLVRITVEDQPGQKIRNWADAEAPDKPDQTMSNFLQNIDKLRPSRFEPKLDAKDLTLMVKATYQRGSGAELGYLELFEQVLDPGAAPEGDEAEQPREAKRAYYIRTELTRTYALVPLGAATRITEDIGQLFGP